MTCPRCGESLALGAAFCENCGSRVSPEGATTAAPVEPPPIDEDGPISTPTATPLRSAARGEAPPAPTAAQTAGAHLCTQCGGQIGSEGYCESCGLKAPSPRDHFEEAPVSWLAGVCDRGIVHSRNEDAMALWAAGEAPGRAVMVVCDGVSSSADSDVAALAGARAAREVLKAPLPAGLGVPESVDAAAAAVFVAAAAAANAAVVAHTDPASVNPASCTFVCATLEPVSAALAGLARLRYAVIGDSRAYWFPDGGTGVQLTVDDSMAQMLIAGGMPREQAEAAPQAHAITKWLGKDSPDIVPVVGSLDLTEPGWVLVCSDGLWNYASDAQALVAQIRPAEAAGPLSLSRSLVAFATAAGGRDNITVAVARVGRSPGAPDPAIDSPPGAPDRAIDSPPGAPDRAIDSPPGAPGT